MATKLSSQKVKIYQFKTNINLTIIFIQMIFAEQNHSQGLNLQAKITSAKLNKSKLLFTYKYGFLHYLRSNLFDIDK